jgi:hypothetical protein
MTKHSDHDKRHVQDYIAASASVMRSQRTVVVPELARTGRNAILNMSRRPRRRAMTQASARTHEAASGHQAANGCADE